MLRGTRSSGARAAASGLHRNILFRSVAQTSAICEQLEADGHKCMYLQTFNYGHFHAQDGIFIRGLYLTTSYKKPA